MNYQKFSKEWQQCSLPLVAILRGVTPAEAEGVALTLVECGFTYLEVPMNSPSPLESIRIMADVLSGRAYVGAGTVLTPQQVVGVAQAGGQLIISPNADVAVIEASCALNLISLPGVTTPSEAFRALQAGAHGLKLFPAEIVTPAVTKALRAVLPREVICLPVGGIAADAAQMRTYVQAGAQGFGLGGGLYQPGMSLISLREKADAYRHAWQQSLDG